MTQLVSIHPEHPEKRRLKIAVDVLERGGVIAYPTDTSYALACRLDDKRAIDRLRRLRALPETHHLTLVCRDLSELANYAEVNNSVFRLLKSYTPGPYTFLLPATHEVPRRLRHPKRKTIGLRIPNAVIVMELLRLFDQPLISTSLILPDESLPITDPEIIQETLKGQLDLIIDGGYGGIEPTSVIDLTRGTPQIIREGLGDVEAFQS